MGWLLFYGTLYYTDNNQITIKNNAAVTISVDSKSQCLCYCPSRSLLDQLKELQALVASTHPTKAQAGTCLMVLFLAFGLVLFPINKMPGEQKNSVATYAPAIGELNCSRITCTCWVNIIAFSSIGSI